MKNLLLVICLALSFTMVKGQSNVPGYLGKRHAIGIQYLPGLGLAGGTSSVSYRKGLKGWGRGEGEFYITHSYSASYSYVLSKRSRIGLSLRQGWMGMRSTFATPDFERLKTLAGGFHIDFFPFLRKGTIAPIGPYTRLKALWTYSRNFTLEAVSSNPQVPKTDSLVGSMMQAYALFEFGNNIVISDWVSLSPGFSFSLGIPALVNTGTGSTSRAQRMANRLQSGWGANFYVEMSLLL